MQLGEKTPAPLSLRRRRAIKIAIAIVLAIALISAVSHFTYRDWPAFVVGDEHAISSAADGTIARLLRSENEAYSRGDELVVIESEDLRTQLAAVEHDLAEIARSLRAEQSELGIERRRFELETAIAQTESQLLTARADLAAIEQVLPSEKELRDLAHTRKVRGEELHAAGALTAAELEERRRGFVAAELQYAEALARREGLWAKAAELERVLGLHRIRLAKLGDERTTLITDLEIMLQEKVGERERLAAALAALRIVADHDGMVTSVLRKEGEYVPGGGAILRVMRNETLWVEAYMAAGDKLLVAPGDRVEVIARAPAGRLAGRVSKVLPVLKPLPLNLRSPLSRAENYAVVIIAMDDPAAARSLMSPAEQVTARIRRRLHFGSHEAPTAEAKP